MDSSPAPLAPLDRLVAVGGVRVHDAAGAERLGADGTERVFEFARGSVVFEVRARSLAQLLPRDRALVEWTVSGLALEEQAQRPGISYTAARQSRHRALARLRGAFAALEGIGG